MRNQTLKQSMLNFERNIWDVEQYAKAYAQYLSNKSQVYVERSQFIKDMLSCTDSQGNDFDWLAVLMKTEWFQHSLPPSLTPWSKADIPYVDDALINRESTIREAIESRYDIVAEGYSNWETDDFWSPEAIELFNRIPNYSLATLSVNGMFVRVFDVLISMLLTRDGYTDGTERDIPALPSSDSPETKFSSAQAVLSINESIEAMGVAVTALAGVSSLSDESTPSDVRTLIESKVDVATKCGKANLDYAVATLAEKSIPLRSRVLAYADSISDSTVAAGEAESTDFNPIIESGSFSMKSPAACLVTAWEETSTVDRITGGFQVAKAVTKGLFKTVGKWLKSGVDLAVETYQEKVAPIINNTPLKFDDAGSGCIDQPSFHAVLTLEQMFALPIGGYDNVLDALVETHMTPAAWSVYGSQHVLKTDIDSLPPRSRSLWRLMYFEENLHRLINASSFACWDNKLFKMYVSRKVTEARDPAFLAECQDVIGSDAIPDETNEYHVYLYLCPRNGTTIFPCDYTPYGSDVTLDEVMTFLENYCNGTTPLKVGHVYASCIRNVQAIHVYAFLNMCVRTQVSLDYDFTTEAVTERWDDLTTAINAALPSNRDLPHLRSFKMGSTSSHFLVGATQASYDAFMPSSEACDEWGNANFMDAITWQNDVIDVSDRYADDDLIKPYSVISGVIPHLGAVLLTDCVYNALTNKVSAMSAFGASGGYSELGTHEYLSALSDNGGDFAYYGSPYDFPWYYPGNAGKAWKSSLRDNGTIAPDLVFSFRDGFRGDIPNCDLYPVEQTRLSYDESVAGIARMVATRGQKRAELWANMKAHRGGCFYTACSYSAVFRYQGVFTAGIRHITLGSMDRHPILRLPSNGFLMVGETIDQLKKYVDALFLLLDGRVDGFPAHDLKDRGLYHHYEQELLMMWDLLIGKIPSYYHNGVEFTLAYGNGMGDTCSYDLESGEFSGAGVAIVPVRARWLFPFLTHLGDSAAFLPDYCLTTQSNSDTIVNLLSMNFALRIVNVEGTVYQDGNDDGVHLRNFSTGYCVRSDALAIVTDEFPIFRPYSYEITPPKPTVIIRTDTEMMDTANALANVIVAATAAALAAVLVIYTGVKVTKFVKKFIAKSKVKSEALNDEALATRKKIVSDGKKQLNQKRQELGVGQADDGSWVKGDWIDGKFSPSVPSVAASKADIKELKKIEDSFSPNAIANNPLVMKNAKKRKWEETKRNIVGSISGGAKGGSSSKDSPSSDVPSDATMSDALDQRTRDAVRDASYLSAFKAIQNKLGGDFGPDLPTE